MKFFEQIGVANAGDIDWDITPELTFTMFESWGSRLWIRSLEERYYYFYIDNWQKPAKLCLMERGLKFARVVAEISAPQEMVDSCVVSQGRKVGLDKSFAINDEIKKWLQENILNGNDSSKVHIIQSGLEVEDMASGLPASEDSVPALTKIKLRNQPAAFVEDDISAILNKHNFFDVKRNTSGNFNNYLVDNGDGLTVTDLVTGTMWQRGGYDLTSIRKMNKVLQKCNEEKMAGFSDWRLPTAEEALSLLEPEENSKGLYLHKCFSKVQPFVFLADQRIPGGYWFVDFKQGTIYWASGTNPGGFGRFCRTV